MNVSIPGQRTVIGFYGKDMQCIVAAEECAELIQAVTKMLRLKKAISETTVDEYNLAYSNLVEEMADVLIILEQLQMIFKISDHEIQRVVEEKCARQEVRMHEHV